MIMPPVLHPLKRARGGMEIHELASSCESTGRGICSDSWVGLILIYDVLPFCSTAQSVLPISHQPKSIHLTYTSRCLCLYCAAFMNVNEKGVTRGSKYVTWGCCRTPSSCLCTSLSQGVTTRVGKILLKCI